ncbi:MAG: dinitrogenase iron-molybdenum cofactor biosynthesis protein [Spirochaetae bacterium HGW-Spirochaetae-1]|jgi:predicted Fe-Mo cluster-binding NifX family protein|nr:MAG: dinitrogenase iron-molybdenum cofactor biosynthesis protein [Spirochaetae bacterium HGW-Spirochaetae-1]
MKIAITSEGKDLQSTVDPRFGRAKGFIIYDEASGKSSYIDNVQNLNAPQGAGIQSAKNIVDAGAEVLITGNVGPKAFNVLNQASVKIMIGASGSVSRALEDFKAGKLQEAGDANVEGHW